jgi:hypothetical protein
MYHKVTNHDGKQWAYYICSSRYQFGIAGSNKLHKSKKDPIGKLIFHKGCDEPILQAKGDPFPKSCSADELIAWAMDEKFAEPGFVQARIEEALAAADTEETKRNLAAAQKEVKDMEAEQENFAVAIGSTKNASVTKLLVKKMEALDTEIALARTRVRFAQKEVTRQIDPVAAAAQVMAAFKGFQELPVRQQKEVLNQHVSRIDYLPPTCAGDVSAMFNVTMKLNEINGVGVSNSSGPF